MPHRFVIKDRESLYVFDRYEDIPKVFDHVIEFAPEIPPGPHSHAEHEEIAQWNGRLQKLMERERASSSKKR